MKCEECCARIEEYHDGELDAQSARQIESHVAVCAACSTVLDDLRQEQVIYTRYERDVEVSPALWASIRTRIEAERPAAAQTAVAEPRKAWRELIAGLFAAPRLSPAFAAALVVITVGVTIAVMSYLNSTKPGSGEQVAAVDAGKPQQNGNQQRPGQETVTPAPVTPPQIAGPEKEPSRQLASKNNQPRPKAVKPELTPEQLVREAESKYLAAIAILSRDVNKRKSNLDPSVITKFEIALANIDRAIAETKQAVQQNPADPVALQYMLAAYSKKMDLLRDMAGN
jgi:anti-sigma factor RsiW